ncbi:type IV secretion system protein [Asticcacaulis sp. W401b]|uniref:type IV secretion system protein n=1 Tax=Asticcacaulis sp. W401b TaxID=3388666 RepID=UPI00397092AD
MTVSFFTNFEAGMDEQLAFYLSSTAANLCAIAAPIVATGIVIYIILIGYAVMRGEASDSLHSSMWKAVKWSLIAAVSLSAGGFNSYIVGGLNGIEAGLFEATTGVASGGELLDQTVEAFFDLFNKLQENLKSDGIGLMPNMAVVIAVIVLALATLIFFGFAVCVFMLAKVAGVLVIALGPVFVVTLIFPPIQRFADAWLSSALNTIIIKVLAGIVLAISTLFLENIVEQVTANFDTTAIFLDVVKVLVLSVSFGFIFGYIPMLAASLVGGAPMPHFAMPRMPSRRSSWAPPANTGSSSGGTIQQGRNAPSTPARPLYRRNSISHLNK